MGAGGMANSIDPVQTAPYRSSLIRVSTGRSDLSVSILRVLWYVVEFV